MKNLIKKILKEEMDTWEWTDGDIDLKHILDIIFEGTEYYANMGNLSGTLDNDDIYIFKRGDESDGHFEDFKRDQTLEDVLTTISRTLSRVRMTRDLHDEYMDLYKVIERKSKELFGM